MNYDYRTSAQHPSYRPSSVYGNSMYPRVASQHGQGTSAGRPAPSRHTTPLPPLSSLADIPRSSFQFNFDFERKILAEAEKESQNWIKIAPENVPSRASRSCPSPSPGPREDPILSKYLASGLSREAVPFAVSAHGDNPAKVREFVNGYTLLREMGFPSTSIAEALIMYENDTDKALAHFLNSSS
ncbi:uncharacterized protein LOC116194844 isoform X3 [Punica granatum]|uniref:Uncharacterized protein LOC116194844 isoform X3 n=1 Tax=Punica granatum TaxID=22663 RepID=A0A6P8CDP4_PUNGR|nr:uncharacterized protein LOC116194844 isoform X3 [Punica granatum]